jgi:hypothetical protein
LLGIVILGPRGLLSLSIMLTVALTGLSRRAFAGLLNTTLNVSFDSLMTSFVMNTLKLFAVSPGANVSVPEIAV